MESSVQNSNNYNRYAPQDYYIAFTRETKWHENLQAHVSMYMVDEKTATRQLELLIVAFTFSNLEEIYERLIKGTFQGYGTDYVEIHNKNNTVTIKHPTNSWGDVIQVSTTNFIDMIETWNTLRQEDTETIYFIQKPDRTILVQKNLDGAHVAEVQEPQFSTQEIVETSFTRSKIASPDKPLAQPSVKKAGGARYLIFTLRHTGDETYDNKVCITFASTYQNLPEDSFRLFIPLLMVSNREEIYEFLQEPLELFYRDEAIQIHKDNESVIIEGSQGCDKEKQLVIKTDNLIQLLLEWEALINNDSAKIYIVEEGDSPVIATIKSSVEIIQMSPFQNMVHKLTSFFKNIF